MSQLPKTAAARGKTAPAKFAHVVLRTRPDRFEALVSWYQTVLEAEIVYGNPVLAFMTYDDEHHRVAVVAMPHLEERPLETIGVDHLAFTYASLGELVHTYERLKARGIEPATTIHHGPTMSLYYLDPDKNQVELQIDVFENAAEIDAFVNSGLFAKNPIGVVFDMDEIVGRYRSGESAETLIQPIDGPLPPKDTFSAH